MKRNPYNQQQLAQIAKRLRHAGKIERQRAFDVLEFIKTIAAIFPGLKIVPVLDDKLPFRQAEANSATNTVIVRQSLITRLENWDPTARFIMIEEFCHIALGHTGPRYRRDATCSKIYSPSEQQDEREARHLAALMLAPTELVGDLFPGEIAAQFGLSEQASEIRWEEVQTVKRRELGIRRELPSNVIDFLREKQRQGHRITALDDEVD